MQILYGTAFFKLKKNCISYFACTPLNINYAATYAFCAHRSILCYYVCFFCTPINIHYATTYAFYAHCAILINFCYFHAYVGHTFFTRCRNYPSQSCPCAGCNPKLAYSQSNTNYAKGQSAEAFHLYIFFIIIFSFSNDELQIFTNFSPLMPICSDNI